MKELYQLLNTFLPLTYKVINCLSSICYYKVLSKGREYQAMFLSTYEFLDENKSRYPTKSLCNPNIFYTVISHARALVVAVGNPLQLLKIEEVMGSVLGCKERCWREYLRRCLKHKALYFPQSYSSSDKEMMLKVIQSNV